MVPLKLFAKPVANLTDARYFAALGADYIGFVLNPSLAAYVEPSLLLRLKEWLEGPKIIGCFRGNESEETLTKSVVDCALDGLFFETPPQKSQLDVFSHLALFIRYAPMDPLSRIEGPNINIVVRKEDLFGGFDRQQLIVLEEKIRHQSLYVEGEFDEAFLNSEWFAHRPGLILAGSDEEKVGFKSFDALDALFDRLEAIG